MERKRVTRRQALGRRRRLGASERERLGGLITSRALELKEVERAGVVLAFASFGTETPTDGIIARLLDTGRTVLLPSVDGDRLVACPVASLEEVAPGYRGIREPVRRDPVAPVADVVLVPGVAFDSGGARLGYGGGFYDRFLPSATGFRVGLCFETQLIAEVPAGPGDEPVEVIVTEERVVRTLRTLR